MKKICEMTFDEYVKLRDDWMFWEFYPEAEGDYDHDTELSLDGKFKIEEDDTRD